ncbi:MAG: hypothetical protein JG765_965 [Cereibacter sp.]|jgi:hypothetical protein|nr:hypothetical protein [Cereibacter sp.]
MPDRQQRGAKAIASKAPGEPAPKSHPVGGRDLTDPAPKHEPSVRQTPEHQPEDKPFRAPRAAAAEISPPSPASLAPVHASAERPRPDLRPLEATAKAPANIAVEPATASSLVVTSTTTARCADLPEGEQDDPLTPAAEQTDEAAPRSAPALPGATEREMPLPASRDASAPARPGPLDQGAPRPLPPEVAPALVDLAKGSGGGVEVALSPAELGSVTLRMEQEGAGLRVTVSADRPDTLDLLRRNADQLQQELKTAGFAGSSFSFTERGGFADQGAQRQPAAPPPERERLFAAPFSRTPSSLPPQGGGLDLRM